MGRSVRNASRIVCALLLGMLLFFPTLMIGVSVGNAVAIMADATSPQVAIGSPSDGSIINGSTVSASWSGTDADIWISYYLVAQDGGSWLNASLNTTWTFNGLSDGEHTISVSAYDGAGNSGNATVNFTVDTVAPTIIDHSPTGSNVVVSHYASRFVTFSEPMNMSSVRMAANGVNLFQNWVNNTTFNPTRLSYNFTYTVNVTGKDRAGNPVDYSWSFTTAKQGGVIEGTIRDPSGTAIAEATVSLDNGMTATTDAIGQFSFADVTAGSYNLSITKVGFQTRSMNVTAGEGMTNDLGALSVQAITSSNSDGIVIALVAMAVVAGLAVAALMFFRRRKV